MNETENFDPRDNDNTEQTLEQTDKKCPSCGGTLDFNPETGELVCVYCGAEVDIEDDEKERAAEISLEKSDLTKNCDWGEEKRTVVCKSCGAETVYSAETVSGECPYCGSNQVMEAGGEDIMAPGGVCPFTVTRENASLRFSSWIKGKLFCSKAAKDAAKAGKINGIYLPYWTFDSDTHTNYTAKYGRERVVRKGKETHVRIDWYHTSGTYDEFINDELVCATKNHDKAMLSGIEPFDTENNLAYKPEYLAGFVSERYSVGIDDAWGTAKENIHSRIDRAVEHKVERDHHTSHVSGVRTKTKFYNVTYKYLLLPVWMSSFNYNGKNYRFMVNGRTGKVSGKYPVSPLRVTIAVLLGISAALLLAYLFMQGSGGDVSYYLQNAENCIDTVIV